MFDFIRRFVVYALTYVLGFLGTLVAVAAATRMETTSWMPIFVGIVLLLSLSLLPPFKSIVLRLAVAGFFTSGALAAWFISEPAAASEPNERFNALVPILGSAGPLACGIVLLLLWEERKVVTRGVWFWLLPLIALGWLLSFYSSMHNLTGAVLIPHPSFRYSNDFAAVHSIPDRRRYQVLYFIAVTLISLAVAMASKATKASKLVFALSIPVSFALFDELRNSLEYTGRVSKRDLALDIAVIFVTALVGALISNSLKGTQGSEPITPDSGNNL